VSDLTHLLAELTENAVHFSPPNSQVMIRSTPEVRAPGTWVLTVEDWGVGMPPDDLARANTILLEPRSFDVAASQRLGLHVVARLAHRHEIQVSLSSTSMMGITAVVQLPPSVFATATNQVSGRPVSGKPVSARTIPGRTPDGRDALPASVRAAAPTSTVSWSADASDARPAHLPVTAARGLSPVPDVVRAAVVDLRTDDPDEPEPAATVRLDRRQPQTHLAPQLQRGGASPARPSENLVRPTDAVRARQALSQYQSSREAALAAASRDDSDEGRRR